MVVVGGGGGDNIGALDVGFNSFAIMYETASFSSSIGATDFSCATRTTYHRPSASPSHPRCSFETNCLFEWVPRRRTTESYARRTRTVRTWSVSKTGLRGERKREQKAKEPRNSSLVRPTLTGFRLTVVRS